MELNDVMKMKQIKKNNLNHRLEFSARYHF